MSMDEYRLLKSVDETLKEILVELKKSNEPSVMKVNPSALGEAFAALDKHAKSKADRMTIYGR